MNIKLDYNIKLLSGHQNYKYNLSENVAFSYTQTKIKKMLITEYLYILIKPLQVWFLSKYASNKGVK